MTRSWSGLRCALPLDPREILAFGVARVYSDRKEANAASAEAVTDMMTAFPSILFLQIPLFQELENQDVPEWRGLVEDLSKAVPQAKIISMRPANTATTATKSRLRSSPDEVILIGKAKPATVRAVKLMMMPMEVGSGLPAGIVMSVDPGGIDMSWPS